MSFIRKIFNNPAGCLYRRIANFILKIRFKIYTICFLIKYKYILKIIDGASGIKIYQKVIIDGPGRVKIGKNVSFGLVSAPNYYGHYTFISTRYPSAELNIGDDCIFSNNISIVLVKSVSIGNKCMIGHNAEFMDSDFHSIDPVLRHTQSDFDPAGNYIKLDENVMVGANAICGPNVTAGKNSVIAMGALLKNKDFPENSVIVGNPARGVMTIGS